ncbi:hypothetical protein D3C71_1908610 [compost metagenome]
MIKLGINTLQTAIANPRIAVPIYRFAAPAKERITIPTVKKIRANKIKSSTPYLRPSFGTRGDNKAKVSNGTVVIRPAKVLEI